MKGIRIESYTNEILKIKEILEEYEDLIQVGILHELIDDTPYKTENYLKYNQDNYNVVHNKKKLIDNCIKYYELNPSETGEKIDLFSVIRNRKSVRDYINKKIPFEDFSNIIFYSFGVKSTGRGAYDQKEYPFKYVNSQGGLNYLDLFLFINNVESVEQGLYYYDFIGNKICQMDNGNFRNFLNEIHFQNEFTIYANFVAVLVADLARVVPKYYKRAYRMAHVDTGIALSYLQIISEYQGVSSCIVAGYLEHILEDILNLSKSDYPVATCHLDIKAY
jgi:SagB-type dehydrogenase family enzyme